MAVVPFNVALVSIATAPPEEPVGPSTARSEQLFAIRGPAARGWGPELLGSRWVEIRPGELGGVPFCLELGQQDRVCTGPRD